MIRRAPSACEAPVIMLRKNSAWPGASISTMSRELVRKRICVVSMVMPWSRSVCSASSRNDHSNGIAALQPHRALALPGGLDHQPVDRRLTDAGLADATADGDARRIAADAIEDFGRHQFVV